LQYGAPEGPDHPFDDALYLNLKFKVLIFFQRKSRHPPPVILGNFGCAVRLNPLENPPIYTLTKRLHQIVSKGSRAFPSYMKNSIGWIQADAKKFLEDGGKKNRITVIKKRVYPGLQGYLRDVR